MADPEVSLEVARRRVEQIHESSLGRAQYQRQIRQACEAALRAINDCEQSREAELAVLRKEFQAEVDRERERAVRTAEDLRAQLHAAAVARKNVEKVAELQQEGSKLTFAGPKGDYGRAAHWTVDDMEAALYDVRHAGGSGTTELDLSNTKVSVMVPYPETVVAARAGREELQESRMDGVVDLTKQRRAGIHPLYGAAGCTLIILVAVFLSFVWPG